MKKFLLTLALAAPFWGIPAFAQLGGPGNDFGNSMEKLFGDNHVFSATMQTEINDQRGPITVKSKMFFNRGNSRTEMNMIDVHGANMPANAVAQMQAIGMDKIVTISPPDKKTIFLIYPNLQSYVGMPVPGADTAATNENYKVQATKLGDETVDGHSCVKNKTLVISSAGKTNEFTVWNATDLNQFPLKIAMTEKGTDVTISFQNVSFGKLGAGLFVPPSNFTRYESIQSLMQQAMAKHTGNAPAAMPPK